MLCPEQGEDDDENARPLAESLLLAIADLLFCPDFTVQSHRRSTVVRAPDPHLRLQVGFWLWGGSGRSSLGQDGWGGRAAQGELDCLACVVPGRGWWLAQLERGHLVPSPAPCIREAGHRLPLSLPGR